MDKNEYQEILDLLSRYGGQGSVSESIFEQLRGLNVVGTHPTMPVNRTQFGMTFFTRPRLNLSNGNLQVFRPFNPMIVSGRRNLLPLAVRVMLDPVGAWQRGDTTLLVDEKQAFIPWLTSGIVSSSGWGDIAPGTFTSQEGNHHESWSIMDDTGKQFRNWDMTTTFRNTTGNLILSLFFVWVMYQTLVYEGDMFPYPEADIEDEIDYYSCCYRLVLDQNRERVVEWYSTLCYPMNVPIGIGANFDINSPFNEEGKQHTINWRCAGVRAFDPATLMNFNKIVSYYNPYMLDKFRESTMVRLAPHEYLHYNYHTFLRIDPYEGFLERWVDRNKYVEIKNKLARGLGLGQAVTLT